MNRIRNIFVIAISVLFASCSGNMDDSSVPVLEVSDTEIDLAVESEAVFTVTYNGQDVTSESEIFSTLGTTELHGNVFRPVNTGSALFYAVYEGKESGRVTVNVVNSKPQVESAFDRHVCVMEFTGAWCINCPEGYDKMMGVLSKPTMSKYKENIHICAFHSDLEGADELAIPATQDVFGLFESLAYPSFATDLRDSGLLTSDGISLFQPSVMASFTEHLPHCGVAVSSSVADGQAEITVKVRSELASQYRVLVLAVEDGIKGKQKTPYYPEGDADYVHRHVVRKVVSSYSGTFAGERITEDGFIGDGEEASKTWTLDIDDGWVLEKTHVYALAIDNSGYVNNMNVCLIDGGDSGYDLK